MTLKVPLEVSAIDLPFFWFIFSLNLINIYMGNGLWTLGTEHYHFDGHNCRVEGRSESYSVGGQSDLKSSVTACPNVIPFLVLGERNTVIPAVLTLT